jgi:hypothetical protein
MAMLITELFMMVIFGVVVVVIVAVVVGFVVVKEIVFWSNYKLKFNPVVCD